MLRYLPLLLLLLHLSLHSSSRSCLIRSLSLVEDSVEINCLVIVSKHAHNIALTLVEHVVFNCSLWRVSICVRQHTIWHIVHLIVNVIITSNITELELIVQLYLIFHVRIISQGCTVCVRTLHCMRLCVVSASWPKQIYYLFNLAEKEVTYLWPPCLEFIAAPLCLWEEDEDCS